jgi:hypothetical protein
MTTGRERPSGLCENRLIAGVETLSTLTGGPSIFVQERCSWVALLLPRNYDERIAPTRRRLVCIELFAARAATVAAADWVAGLGLVSIGADGPRDAKSAWEMNRAQCTIRAAASANAASLLARSPLLCGSSSKPGGSRARPSPFRSVGSRHGGQDFCLRK